MATHPSLIRSVTAAVEPYVTKDGLLIREVIHPDHHGNRNQSLAEAVVAVGGGTRYHRHETSEEIYLLVAGSGEMILNGERIAVTAGDAVCIPPGTAHRLHNTGAVPLRLWCCCAPAYSHQDTTLLEE